MKLKCIAIDDEMPALEKLKTYIGRVPYLELSASFDNAIDAGNFLADNSDINVVFIDIYMPDLNGMEFVRQLGENRPEIVFISAYPHYAVDSYRTGAVDYLLKPYDYDDFCRAAGRIVERVNVCPVPSCSTTTSDQSFFVKVDNRWIKLRPDQVEYIRGYGDYLRIYISDRANPLVTYSTMSAIKDILPPDFLQVHRSYIVNMAQGVTAVERNRLISKSNHEIPIGDSFRDTIADYLSERSISKENRKRTNI